MGHNLGLDHTFSDFFREESTWIPDSIAQYQPNRCQIFFQSGTFNISSINPVPNNWIPSTFPSDRFFYTPAADFNTDDNNMTSSMPDTYASVMDYSRDKCNLGFTKCQCLLMRFILRNFYGSNYIRRETPYGTWRQEPANLGKNKYANSIGNWFNKQYFLTLYNGVLKVYNFSLTKAMAGETWERTRGWVNGNYISREDFVANAIYWRKNYLKPCIAYYKARATLDKEGFSTGCQFLLTACRAAEQLFMWEDIEYMVPLPWDGTVPSSSGGRIRDVGDSVLDASTMMKEIEGVIEKERAQKIQNKEIENRIKNKTKK